MDGAVSTFFVVLFLFVYFFPDPPPPLTWFSLFFSVQVSVMHTKEPLLTPPSNGLDLRW